MAYKQLHHLMEWERMVGEQDFSSNKHISWRTSSPVKCFHSLPFQLLPQKLKPNRACTFLYI